MYSPRGARVPRLEEQLHKGQGLTADFTRLDRRALCGEDFVAVETLPAYSCQQGDLWGAVNLPPTMVRELPPALLPDRSAEIVIYCSRPT